MKLGTRGNVSRWRWGLLLIVVLLCGCTQEMPWAELYVRDARDGTRVDGYILAVDGQVVAPTPVPGGARIALENDIVELIVRADGYVSETVLLTVGERVVGQHRTLDLARSVLCGVVEDSETGLGIDAAVIRAGDWEISVSADGTFELDAGLIESLVVEAQGYRPAQVSSAVLSGVLGEDGSQVRPLTVALDACSLDGRVVDRETGQSVVGADVRWNGGAALTGEDGRFTVDCLPEETELTVRHAQYRPVLEAVSGKQLLEVAVSRWELALTVVDKSDGNPLSGAVAESASTSGRSDEMGVVTLQPTLGESFTVALDGYHTQSTVFEGQDALTVRLASNRLRLRLESIETGEPITTGLALVYSLDGSKPAMLTPDSSGQVLVDGVEAVGRVLCKVPGYRIESVVVSSAGEQTVMMQPFEARGVYIPLGLLTRPERLAGVLDLVEGSSELNSIVVDVKGDRAYLAWDSAHPIARDTEGYIDQCIPLEELLADCEQRGIYVIARVVVFKDDLLAESHPEWAVMREDGGTYRDLEGLRWVDPFEQAVRDYNVALVVEIAEMGFDEVQLDYLRFPSDGSTKDNVYAMESNFQTRTEAMEAFCRQVSEAIAPTPAFLSADIFGLTVWVDDARDMGIGQRLCDIAPYVDYVCPMLYPSTFGEGNLGFDYPVRYPYEIIYHSVVKTRSRTDTQVRPWLQHYSLAVEYGVQELLRQKLGAEDGEAHGWLFWNAGAKYDASIFAPDAYDLLDPWPELEDD